MLNQISCGNHYSLCFETWIKISRGNQPLFFYSNFFNLSDHRKMHQRLIPFPISHLSNQFWTLPLVIVPFSFALFVPFILFPRTSVSLTVYIQWISSYIIHCRLLSYIPDHRTTIISFHNCSGGYRSCRVVILFV